MFKKDKITTNEQPSEGTKTIVDKVIPIIEKPKICCVDLKDEVISELVKNGYNIFNGKMGEMIRVPNKKSDQFVYIKLNFNLPDNFHEYDILILDLNNIEKKDYIIEEHNYSETIKNTLTKLICKYPTTTFDPKPLVSSILSEKMLDISKKEFIQIIFACESYNLEYESININSSYTSPRKTIYSNIYEFCRKIPLYKPLYGKEVKLDIFKNKEFINLLEKHKQDLQYFQTFEHPKKFDSEKQESLPIKNFIPLLRNIHNDIVSFIYVEDNMSTLVFPHIKNKSSFLVELLSNILPDIVPYLFPYSTKYKWLEESEYFLPNHKNLLVDKNALEENFNKENKLSEDKIIENHKKYQFLHALLIETDEGLVKAIFSFFNWLEFKKTTIMDEFSENIKEEDLQVELENGILIIETKGIGGTSTDPDCSQISKIKHRRCEERGKFDVYALYIVNHQRHLPAGKRKNPPFTENQIRDAKNDKRGLLTTWQLFNLYFDIQNKIITKEEARQELIKVGLIEFKPQIKTELGIPIHIYKNGSVIILEIDNVKLKVGQTLIAKYSSRHFKTNITSIKLNDKFVNEVKDFKGEIGLEVDSKISKGTTFYI